MSANTNFMVNCSDGGRSADFYLEPTSLWYAENSLNQALELMVDLQTKMQSVVNNSGVLVPPYSGMVSLGVTSYNDVVNKITDIAKAFADYKSLMIAADSSLELLFLYMDMTGGEIALDDPSELSNKSEDEMTLLILQYYLEYYEKCIELNEAEIDKLYQILDEFCQTNADWDGAITYYGLDDVRRCYKPSEIEEYYSMLYPESSADEIKKMVSDYEAKFDEHFKVYMGQQYGTEMTFSQLQSLITSLNSDIAVYDSARYDTVQDITEYQFKIDYPLTDDGYLTGILTVDMDAWSKGEMKFLLDGEPIDINKISPMLVAQFVQNGNIPQTSDVTSFSYQVNRSFISNSDTFIPPEAFASAADFLIKLFSGEDLNSSNTYSTVDLWTQQLSSITNGLDYEYLTADQIDMYNRYYSQYGRVTADAYLESIRDTINQQKGMARAAEEIAKATDENGNIDWSKVSIDGVAAGVESWGEGLYNVFHADGVRTDGQYMQMYYMQHLTNSSGLYVQDLIGNYAVKNGDDAALDFYENLINTDGSINLAYAEQNLTDEEYQLLLTKISNDSNNWNTFCYEMGTAVGNMLPSTIISLSLSWIPPLSIAGHSLSVASIVGQTAVGLSIYGNSKNEALIAGHDLFHSRLYATLSAVSEVSLSLLLGNIPGLNPNATFSLMGILSEGGEEFLQEYISAGISAMVLGDRVDLDQLNEQALKSFLYGCILSFGSNAVSMTGESVGMGLNLYLDGKKINFTDVNSIINFMSVLNNGDVKFGNYYDDRSAFIIPADSNVDLSVMQELFPGVPVLKMEGNGNDAKIVDVIVDGVSVTQYANGNSSSSDLIANIDALSQLEDIKVVDRAVSDGNSTPTIAELELVMQRITSVSPDTDAVVSRNLQGLTNQSISSWVKNFNKLTDDQLKKFDACIQFISSLSYDYSKKARSYGIIETSDGTVTDFNGLISKIKSMLNEAGLTFVDEQLLANILKVAPSLITTDFNTTKLNNMIQRMVSNLFYTSGEKIHVSNIESLARIIFGDDLSYIDVVTHPDNKNALAHKLNDFEVRVLYNYNEFCILRNRYAPCVVDATWVTYSIQEQIDISRQAYTDRNNLRIGSQNLGIGDNDLPATGTNPLMSTFEGGFIYNYLKAVKGKANVGVNNLQAQFFNDVLSNERVPASIKNLILASDGQIDIFMDNLKKGLIPNKDTGEVAVTKEEMIEFYSSLLSNSEYSDLLSVAAKSIIESSYKSNPVVNSLFGIVN